MERGHTTQTSRGKGAWVRVSGSQPCPICEHKTFCTISADGAVVKCMRIESDRPANGTLGGWIHRMGAAVKVKSKPQQEVCISETDWTRFAAESFAHELAFTARLQIAGALGVGPDALKRLQVGYGYDDYRKLGYTTWPESRPGGKVVGIVRRYGVPVKDGGNKLMLRGSKHGLYLPLNWWEGKGPILIPEGGSDTAAIMTLGMTAIGRPSNLGGVNMLIGALQDQAKRPVIVLGERDEKPTEKQCKKHCGECVMCYPGLYGCKATAERLAIALKRHVLWRLMPDGFKDIRDWLNRSERPTAARLLNQLTYNV